MNTAMEKFIAIDVETSGTDVFENELLSIALVPFDDSIPSLSIYLKHDLSKIKWGGRGSEFFQKYESTYMQASVDHHHFCFNIQNYIDKFFTKGATLVGHNVGFDYYFLKKVFHQANINFPLKISHRLVDTHSILMYLHLQDKLSEEYLGSNNAFDLINNESSSSVNRHTAEMDSLLVKNLLHYLVYSK
jgi:DNA polymerase-3 subunit epsilon